MQPPWHAALQQQHANSNMQLKEDLLQLAHLRQLLSMPIQPMHDLRLPCILQIPQHITPVLSSQDI